MKASERMEQARLIWNRETREEIDMEGITAMLAFADDELEQAAVKAERKFSRQYGHVSHQAGKEIAAAIRAMKGDGK